MGVVDFLSRFINPDSSDFRPTPTVSPSRSINYLRLGDLMPYQAWDEENRVFVLSGEHQDKTDAIGFALEMIPQTGAPKDMADLLATIYAYMPARASVQWHLLASPLIDDFLSDFVSLRQSPDQFEPGSEAHERAELYQTITRAQAAHYEKGATRPMFSATPYLLRKYRLVMSVTIPAKSPQDAEALQELTALRETCATSLKTYYLYSHEWKPEHLINWCAIILNPQRSMLNRETPQLNYDEGKPISQQIVAHDTLCRLESEGLFYGMPGADDELAVRQFSVHNYPKLCTLNMMGSMIGDYMQSAVGYSCPFMITIGIATQDFESTRANTQIRQARAVQRAESPMARFMPELRDIRDDWDLAGRAFDEGTGTVKIYHQVTLFAKPSEMARAAQTAQAVWRAKQFELVDDRFMHLQASLGCMPMALTPDLQRDIQIAQRFSTKTAVNAVNMAPLLAEWSGVGDPVIPLWGRRGQAMSIDLFGNQTGNFNACVVGTSGSGKSAFLNLLTLSYAATGGKVWIVDIGRSYEKLARTIPGAQYIEFTAEANIRMNPWSLVRDIAEDIEMLVPLFSQMISPSNALGDYEKRQLTMHIQSVWFEFGNEATIDHLAYSLINNCEKGGPNPRSTDEDFVQMIRDMNYDERQNYCDPRIRDLGVQLYSFTSDGPYGKFFEGESNVNFDADFIVLELEELSQKKDLQAVVMFLLMFQITSRMYFERDRRKVCVLDEAWALLAGAASGDFIESGYRRARKYGGSFISATQSINDYSISPAAEAALANADWMFLLRQKPESVMSLRKSGRLMIDDYMQDLLMSVRTQSGAYSEVYVTAGQMGQGIGRIILDPFTLLLASSKAEDFEVVRKYREQGLSVVDSLCAVLADRNVPGYINKLKQRKVNEQALLRKAA